MNLTTRQREVLHALASGLCLKQWSAQVGISYGVAKLHSESAQRKIGARTKAHAVAIAIRQGVI